MIPLSKIVNRQFKINLDRAYYSCSLPLLFNCKEQWT